MKWMMFSLLVCLTVSLSAQSVTGKWSSEFPSDQGTMTLVVEIKADGTYALDWGNDGTIEVTGKYTDKDGKMTINDDSDCRGKGVYSYTVTDKTLTMTRVSDECPERGGPEGKMVFQRK